MVLKLFIHLQKCNVADMAYDCSKLLVDFSKAPKGVKLAKHYPELAAFPQFKQQQDDNIIRIAILTADADSPFLKFRGDREIMIRNIFDFLDIGLNNAKAKEFYQKVVDYKHEAVIECWVAYLQMQYNIDYTDWAMSKQTYDLLISESNRQKGVNEDAIAYANWRIKIRNEIRKIGEDLKEIEPRLFKDSKMARPVALEEIKIRNYPEKYAIKNSIM